MGLKGALLLAETSRLALSFETTDTRSMKNKNTIKSLVQLLEDDDKNENYIIGVLMSMIDNQTTEYCGTMQANINVFMGGYKPTAEKINSALISILASNGKE